jgi:hypothetical protein
MNRLLCFITTACIAAVIILAGNSTVGASDTQALDPAKSTSEKGPDIPTQDDFQNAAKSGSTAKVNVDSQGVIVVKGTTWSPTSNKENRSKGIPHSRARIKVQHTYLPRQWTKPILTKIPQSMRRGILFLRRNYGSIGRPRRPGCVCCLQGQALPLWESGRVERIQD